MTDDEIPDLVDIDRPMPPPPPPPPLGSSRHQPGLGSQESVPMTANSSTSSKTPTTTSGGSKSKKKKKKGKVSSTTLSVPVSSSNGLASSQSQTGEDGHQQKIWNTTTAEEKERIKEFWLGLSEQERRNLVRVEKEHVSKRVKEGSKILNCSCHVCGRKQ